MANRFLTRGVFPKELPGCFSSVQMGQHLERFPAAQAPKLNHQLVAEPVGFSLGRAGGVRRQLAIPNPALHWHLAHEIQAHWDTIIRRIERSTLSISKPVRKGAGPRAAAPATPFARLWRSRASARAHGRYVLSADIAECYRSIYTHSIAWACEGREAAAANPQANTLGNRLDKAIRNGQRKQTNGIPVGPDTSLVISELVLTDLDHEIQQAAPGVRGIRFYDDYELVADSLQEAEQLLATIQTVLRRNGLHLNPNKTGVLELPQPLEREWVHSLRDLARTLPRADALALLKYFDFLAAQHHSGPHENVVALGISHLERPGWTRAQWEVIEPMMFQLTRAEPAAVIHTMKVLDVRVRSGQDINIDLLSAFLDRFLVDHAPLGHSFEVSWALWGALRFEVSLGHAVARALTTDWCDATALLALDLVARRQIDPQHFDKGVLQAVVSPGAMRGPHWLLAYEALVRHWLEPGEADVIAKCAVFAFMREHKVRFYSQFQRARTALDGPDQVEGDADDDMFLRWRDHDDNHEYG